MFSLCFGCSVLGKLGFGLLADRFDLHKVMAAATLTLALSLFLLSEVTLTKQQLIYPYAVLAGLGFSGACPCIQVLIAAHYAGPFYGRILALIVLIDTLCGALGTRAVAFAREWQGDYLTALIGMSVLACLSALVIIKLREPSAPALTRSES